MFAIAVAAFFGLEILYGLMNDATQDQWFVDLSQAEMVILAWLAFAATSYEQTGRKAMLLLVLIYLLWIVCTDWALAWFPPWGVLLESGIFVAFTAYAVWKIHAVAGE